MARSKYDRFLPTVPALCHLCDEENLSVLVVGLELQEKWPDVRRLRELSDPSVSHDWMWPLNPEHGIIVPRDEMGDALRIRLGALLINDTTFCERCGVVVGRSAVHGLCCSLLEGNRGHNTVRNHLLHFVPLAENSASIEVPELIPNAPTLRPADVYTDATFPCGKAALDVGICSFYSGSFVFFFCFHSTLGIPRRQAHLSLSVTT